MFYHYDRFNGSTIYNTEEVIRVKSKLQIRKEMELKSGLKGYCEKYGFDAYIKLLVSTHALIRGGWSYNNAKGDLATKLELILIER